MSTEYMPDTIGDDLADSPRRRRLIRLAIPIGIVVVMLAAILAIALYAYHSNRRDALALSDDVLAALDRRIATEVRTYLAPASKMVELARDTLGDTALSEGGRSLAESIALSALQTYPQLAIFSFADPQGSFMMLKKMPDGSIHTKRIERSRDEARVTWVRRDLEGQVTDVEVTGDDTYDPRARPWYSGAVENRGLHWSDIYIFFTDKKAGVTASLPVFGEDSGEDRAPRAVFGVDIELEQLNAFLAELTIGRTGQALIADADGTLVAYPKLAGMLKEVDGELQPMKIDELGDPALTRAFNRLRVEGHGRRDLAIDGRRYISTASSLRSTVARDWSVLIVAPEEEFVGFVAKNNRTTLLLSLGVLAMASVLAALLVTQGLRADRNARIVLERQRQLQAQSRAFSELSSKATLFDTGDREALGDITEIVSRTVGTRRVSLWRLEPGGQTLVCDDCYDRESNGHTRGSELERPDFPALFEFLDSAEELAVADAARDPRTAELHRAYLHPLGCSSLLSAPILRQQRAVGAVWLEDEAGGHETATEAMNFARSIASMVSLRQSVEPLSERGQVLEHTDMTDASPATVEALDSADHAVVTAHAAGQDFVARADMRTAMVAGNRADAFLKRLAARSDGARSIGAEVYENVNVLVVRLTEPLSLAEQPGDGDAATVVDQLVCALEDLAATHGLEYLKIMSDQIVCACGLSDDSSGSCHSTADAALAIQEQCTRLFTDLAQGLEFRLGLDAGPVIGSRVGREQKVYNLWGEAVRTAALMAETGDAGCIHTTASVYRRLRNHYLFKLRGRYYAQDLGELPTYVLTGRI